MEKWGGGGGVRRRKSREAESEEKFYELETSMLIEGEKSILRLNYFYSRPLFYHLYSSPLSVNLY
jgi:hypothetical protein